MLFIPCRYSNVLTFGAIMTAYLVWRGISLKQIGVWRGVSAAVGLAGTFVYKVLSAKIGLVGSGMLSVTVQFCCLSIAYASLFVDNLTISFAMLIVGVCSSRIGLWVFDISVTQVSYALKVFLAVLFGENPNFSLESIIVRIVDAIECR